MDFKPYPEHFLYHHGNEDDGQEHCVEYAGTGWRESHSSATPLLIPGSERFTLDKVGPEGSVEKGAALLDCGAKALDSVPAK